MRKRILCLLFLCLILSGCKNDTIRETTTIERLHWEVVAEIQEYKTVEESGWEVPDGAVVYKEQEEIKSHKIVGYETKYRTETYQEHVGYYRPTWRPRYETRTRVVRYQEPITEPIFATKYYYTIEKWVHAYNLQLATGETTDYTYNDDVCEENERINGIKYQYMADFTFNGRKVTYVVEKEHWEALQVGQTIIVTEVSKYKPLQIQWEVQN